MSKHIKTRRYKFFLLTFLIGLVGLFVLVLVINFFIFSFNQPDHEELAAEASAIAQSVGIYEKPQRYDQVGSGFEGSIPEERISTTRIGHPEEAFDQLVEALEKRGYTRIEGINPSNPLSGSWRKGKLRVDLGVSGASGFGTQSIVISFFVKPYR